MLAIEAMLLRVVQRVPGMTTKTVVAGPAATLPTVGKFIAVTEYGGRRPWGTHNENPRVYRRPSFQLMAYSRDFLEADNLAEQAFNLVPGSNVLVGDIFFLSIAPIHDPFPMPIDTNGFNRVAFNVETERRA